VIERLSSPDTVFVAVVEGPCGGAGLAIALGCDLLLAAEDAEFVFSSPELFGVIAALGAAVGRARALELCLTGRRLPAAEAASFGLVNLVVGGGELVDAVGDLTAAILGTPRDLAIELKRALRAASSDKISRSEELAAILRLADDDEARGER
jgi:enoyl-CoA hydratase/carnithine racemase